MNPRLPSELARRLDHLAVRAHRFHRWAHHPLCAEYAGERLQLGRIRVCKGCAFAGTGLALGLPLGLVSPGPAPWAFPVLLALAGSWTWALSRPPRPLKEGPHGLPAPRPKAFTRLLPAAVMGFLFAAGLRRWDAAGLGISALAAAYTWGIVAAYRRRGPQRHPCATCPEASGPVPCRGFQRIHRRERAFSRLAARWIALSSSAP